MTRIEKIRTAPLELRVIDAQGKAVRNVSVAVRLMRPAFIFGTEVIAEFLLSETPDGKKYRDTILANVDTTVIGNGMKWPQ